MWKLEHGCGWRAGEMSPWLDNHVEPASAHWFSVKSVINLAVSYIS